MELRRGKVVVLMVVLVVVLGAGGSNGLTMCNMSQEGLDACKPSVVQPNPVPPSDECCSALSTADLTCLCSYKNSLVLPSLGIDPDLALGLPSKCNLTPPSNC